MRLRLLVSSVVALSVMTATIVATSNPATTATGSIRMAAAGDICGNCKPTSDLIVARNPGLVLTLGDNAYDSGTLAEYNTNYDPNWGRFKSKTKPSAGNHEWETSNAAGYRAYFGISSTAPLYGSFSRKAWHFVRLDTDQLASTQQENWMQQDLANDSHTCEIVYGHHPRYSSGSTHGSSSELTSAWNIAANAGVDIWLAGHEHNYERFAPINGIREFVVGTGGADSYPFGSPITGSEKRITDVLGALFLTLKPTSYVWRFRNTAGTVLDSGTGLCH